MSRAVTCNWPHGGMSGDEAPLFDLALTRHARCGLAISRAGAGEAN